MCPPAAKAHSEKRVIRPWGPRALLPQLHGTSPSVSAQVCASGRHPRLMPPRSRSSATASPVLHVSDVLQPSSQLPTYGSESQPARCGSRVSSRLAQAKARGACPLRIVRHRRWLRQTRQKPFDHDDAPPRLQRGARASNVRARRGIVNSHWARNRRRLRGSRQTSSWSSRSQTRLQIRCLY